MPEAHDEDLDVPQGAFRLTRPDAGGRSPLRAWDAADHLLLTHLDSHGVSPSDQPGSTVIVGDAWGALACGLADLTPTVVTDSYVAARAIEANVAVNRAGATIVGPFASVPGRVDLLIMKVDRESAPFEDALDRVAPALHADSVVVTGGMTRDIHRSTLEALEARVGPTVTTQAVRKARLALSTVDVDRVAARAGAPTESLWPRTRHQSPPNLDVTAHAGVFGHRRLDAGTALLLAHLPPAGVHRRVVDLGCGTGVVGTVIGREDPDADITFVDDSARAVASAEATWRAAHGDRAARFVHGDGLTRPEPIEADLVVVNPPFHDGRAQSDSTAWRMFVDARDTLAPGGELLVVGNRHLAHHSKLARIFGKTAVEALSTDPRYVVCRATAPA